MEGYERRNARRIQTGRFGVAVALLAWGLFATAPVRGQGAEEDPLPPLPPIDPTQEPPRDWAAWQGVPKLIGVSQADLKTTYSYSSDTTRAKRSGEAHTSVFMELTRLGIEETGPTQSVQWRVTSANGFGGFTHTDSGYSLGAGHWLGGEGVEQGTYSGPLSLRVEPTLSFRLPNGVGGFMTLGEPPGPWAARSVRSNTKLDTVTGGVQVETFDEVVPLDPWTRPLEASWIDFTAPKPAVPFNGRFALEQTTDEGRGSFRRTASVQFWPDWNDLEVRVELEDSTNPGAPYSDWRPEGDIQIPADAGPRPLRLKATLRPKAESPTAEQLAAMPEVRRFRFELADTSREPGVCLNWPSPEGSTFPKEDPEYDLRFLATIPEAMELSPRKQKAGVRPLPGEDPTLPSAWVLLECFDFGAHANLQVYADLADGRVIVGHLRVGEEKRYLIPIPDRLPGSLVAGKWRDENQVTGPDSEDVDDEPVGDGQKGDGFSVYEEYRGFRVGLSHVSPDPRRKDLFIRNLNGGTVSAACRSLEQNTAVGGRKGLRIWETLDWDEWHASRVMNPNRSANSPRSSDEPQHGLLLEPSDAEGDVIVSYADIVKRPWRPKNTKRVVVHPKDNTVETIAHEIAHAIGVHHHGDLDYHAQWTEVDVTAPDGTRRRRFFEQVMELDAAAGTLSPVGVPFPIRVFREGQTRETLPIQTTNAPPPPKKVFVAQRGGQHSGQEFCIMRYNCAGAYMVPGRPLDRITPPKTIVIEVPGVDIYTVCRSCQGTGINPRRYGHAYRGNCLDQFCVRDSAPERAIPTGQCPDTP